MKNPRFLIIATGYNCSKYVKGCLQSIRDQLYTNYCVYLVDDGSTDDTWKVMKENAEPSWRMQTFSKNGGTYYARDFAIRQSLLHDNFDVIVMLDMDDQLIYQSLARVAGEYQRDIWMTYGNWNGIDGKLCSVDIKYSDDVHAERSYRKDKFRCTHLRTFTPALYKEANKDLLRVELAEYPDTDLLFSMMEIAGRERIACITDPIYIYNTANPLSMLKRFGKDYASYNIICAKEKREMMEELG